MVDNNRFKYERKKIGYTQEQVARKLNTSRSNVANWENGQNMPSLDLIFKCADLYDCDVMYLAGYQNERKKIEDDVDLPEPDDIYEDFDNNSKNVDIFLKNNIESIKNQIMNLSNDVMTEENKKSLVHMVDYFHITSNDNDEKK